jgi:anti-sigma factor RsiW
MPSCDDAQRELSRFLDGSLPSKERTAVRAHLSECTPCRDVHADLLRLRSGARALGPIAPPDHVWMEVAGRIRLQEAPTGARAAAPARPSPPRPGRSRPGIGQWLGLAAALLLLTFGLYWIERRAPEPPSTAAVAPAAVDSTTAELNLALLEYERAIGELESVAASGQSTIDPALAETIQQSLGAIDSAIAESRTALVTNPESEPARASLFDALSRKITTLQTTVSLINEMRQGDQEGAARVAQGQKS